MATTKNTKVNDTVVSEEPKKSWFRGGGMALLSRIAKSLMVPIAVLPFAALLNRIGNLMMTGFTANAVTKYDAIWWVGRIISIPGAVVFDNLSVIFALGIGFGMAKDHRGEAALAATVGFLGLVAMTGNDGLAALFYKNTLTYTTSDVDKLTSSIIAGLPKDTSIANKLKAVTWIDDNGVKHIAQQLQSYFAGKSSLLWMVHSWTLHKLSPDSTEYILVPTVNYFLDVGVIGGIFAGATTAFLYNRYKEVNIPKSLSFFGGRRFIPMLSIASVWVVGLIFATIWPWAQKGLISFGQAIASPSHETGRILGFGAYALLNRLLQPMGLHHIINTFLWFQFPIKGPFLKDLIDKGSKAQNQIIFGDINAFTKGVQGSGIFQGGFFPLYLGGLPAAGLAMTLAAPKKNRKEIGVFLGSVAFVAFLTGIDEPLVFSFIFIAPVLFVLNAILTALMGMVVTASHISLGFGFSAGLIDYLISVPQGWQMSGFMSHTDAAGIQTWVHASSSYKFFANPLMILVWSAIMFGVYLVTFYPIIVKMDIETPGRAKTSDVDVVGGAEFPKTKQKTSKSKNKKTKVDKKQKYTVMAQAVIDEVGKENLVDITNCTTRLRLTVKNNSKTKINDEKLKNAGFNSIIRLGTTALQLVVGTDVEYVTNALEKLMNK